MLPLNETLNKSDKKVHSKCTTIYLSLVLKMKFDAAVIKFSIMAGVCTKGTSP